MCFQNPPWDRFYLIKSTKMHWCSYNNTVPLSNTKITHVSSGFNFKNFEFKHYFICLPAIKPNSASAMALVFSHNKGYHHLITKLLHQRMFIHCTMVFPLILCFFPFSSSVWSHPTRTAVCTRKHYYETCPCL